jgi:hypothetical protein
MMINTSQYSAGGYPGADSNDQELGNGDLRVFWIAALIAILAVSAVVFFKMHRSEFRPATVAQTTVTTQETGQAPGLPAAAQLGQTGNVVRQ